MHRSLLGLLLLLIASCPQSWAVQNPVLHYFSQGNFPLNRADMNTCAQYCNPTTCDADILNNSYTCMLNCAHHTTVHKMFTCSNKQFVSYVGKAVNTVQRLSLANKNDQEKINQLQSKLSSVQKKNIQLSNQNVELNTKINKLKERLAALILLNQNLNTQLLQAQSTINSQAHNLLTLQNEIKNNRKEIEELNEALNFASDELDQLYKRFTEFVGNVENQVGQLFETKTKAMHELNGTFKEKIKEAEKVLIEHEKELIPYVQRKEKELDQLIRDMQETLDMGQEFMNRAKQLVDNSKRHLEKIETMW